MQQKLTLRLEEKLIEKAKLLARQQNSSLSLLVSNYFKALASQSSKPQEMSKTPILNEISGILSNHAKEEDIKKSYNDYLENKYS